MQAKKYEFYQKPFDISKLPPSPPNRSFNYWPFIGRMETKKSKKESTEYLDRLSEWESKQPIENKPKNGPGQSNIVWYYNQKPHREICALCHEISRVGFWVPDEIWKAAIHPYYQNSIICLRCFTRWADEKSVEWDKEIKFYPVSWITHTELI